MNYSEIAKLLTDNELKVTPQRVAVIDALFALKNHPTADAVKEFVQKNHPNLALGTVYNTLETFCEKGIVRKVKTDRDFMRYDIITLNHHHLYCGQCDRIEDFFDEELDEILLNYFSKKPIPGWDIKNIKLQIDGNYKNHKPPKNE
jgi:Fur family transcriptional regulator, peroxide stress response regulator